MDADTVAPGQEPERLWTEKETAFYLGVSEEFLQVDRARKHAGPRIPFHRIGRAIRYDPIDVRAYVARCRVAGGKA